MTGKNVSENDLHAYVDGELDDARMADVEAFLGRHPDKQEMVTQWQRQNERIGALFGPVVDEPMPARLQPTNLNDRALAPSRSWMSIAAALALMVASGMAGWYGRGAVETGTNTQTAASSAPLMVQQAMQAHAVYSVEVLHPVEVSAQQEDHLVKWLSNRLGKPIVAPDLTSKGFSLVGGRLLPASDGPAAQFMYEDGSGRRVTLYAARNASQNLASFRFADKDGIQAFYWLTSDLSFALSGKVTREELRQLSQTVYDQAT